MLTLDRLKLVTSAKYITNLNQSLFLQIPLKYGDFYYKYHQDSPFSLTIIQNPTKDELVIDFSGKILKDDYPNLINRDTIQQCFEQIHSMNICNLNVEAILNNSNVCLCDVTKDVVCGYPMTEIKRHIKASIINYDKWIVRKCKNNGLEIYNAVTTKRRYKRLIVYDKFKELQRAENKCFLAILNDPNTLINRFAGKVRIELNLRSMEQIRNYLHISNNDLKSVLCSTATPLTDIFDEAIDESSSIISDAEVYNKAEKVALLNQCHFDLQAVEMKLRESTPKSSSIRRKMEPYRKLLFSLQKSKPTAINIRSLIA